MKYLLFALLVLTGCTETLKEPTELTEAKAAEKLRYKKGPKHESGCFKIINKKNRRYGCTFQSTQGSMFVAYGQHPAYRDHNDEGTALSSPATWQVTWNRRIRCLDNDGFFIPEDDVKKIKCPERFYHD